MARSRGTAFSMCLNKGAETIEQLRTYRHPQTVSPRGLQVKEFIMSTEQENKAIVGRWFKEFWGNPWNPKVVEELGAPDILLQYSLHAPRRGAMLESG